MRLVFIQKALMFRHIDGWKAPFLWMDNSLTRTVALFAVHSVNRVVYLHSLHK